MVILMGLLLKFTLSRSFLVEVYTTCSLTPCFTQNENVMKKIDIILYRSQKKNLINTQNKATLKHSSKRHG